MLFHLRLGRVKIAEKITSVPNLLFFTPKGFDGTTNDVVKKPLSFQVCIPRTLLQHRGKRV
jgi:hypothetical protein